MKHKILKYLLCLIFIFLFLFGSFNIIADIKEYKESKKTYNALEEYISIDEINTDEPINESKENDTLFPKIDFEELKKINNDVVGWIYNENIGLNYPIVQGTDNSYYLKHLIDGSYNDYGTIYLDYRNNINFNDKHSIIYGHNMQDGTMFSNLTKYSNQDFYNENNSFLIITPTKNYKLELVSGYVTSVYDESWNISFKNNNDLQVWINNTINKSYFQSKIIPTINDNFVTLSTCSYDFDNARFILVGILKEYN